MITDSELSLFNANTLELHYWFDDNSHCIDAFVQNKCEYDFLGVIREIASTFNAEVIIETEPLADGGLRRWFKIISKDESKKATIIIAVVIGLITGVFITPITTSVSKVTEKVIEKIFEDKELKMLEKDHLKLENEKLRLEILEKNQTLQQNTVIKRKRSNFYENLNNYPKVNKVSFLIANQDKIKIEDEQTVYRNNFKNFILVSDDLEPIQRENAIIEIISPVLKKGAYKWVGIYNGSIVPFNMKSNEFKTLVQTGIVKFQNGTSINCLLEIRRKVDNEGLEKIVGYDVLRVNNYFENDKPIETPEGKFHRQKKEADKRQMNIDFLESGSDD